MDINEAAFFYLSDLVNTKTTVPLRPVKSGGYICCSSIFTLEQFVFELGQNSLNWYKIV